MCAWGDVGRHRKSSINKINVLCSATKRQQYVSPFPCVYLPIKFSLLPSFLPMLLLYTAAVAAAAKTRHRNLSISVLSGK